MSIVKDEVLPEKKIVISKVDFSCDIIDKSIPRGGGGGIGGSGRGSDSTSGGSDSSTGGGGGCSVEGERRNIGAGPE